MDLIAVAQLMAMIALYLLVTAVCLAGVVVIYLGVRKAARREIEAERHGRQ